MKIAHLVPTGGWYGSEVIASAMANAQVAEHDVSFVWTEGVGFDSSLARKKIDPKVDLVVIPTKYETPWERARWVHDALGRPPDILHSHLGPGSLLAQALDYKEARWVGNLHIRFFWKHFANTDGVVAISDWQLRDLPKRYDGKSFLVRNFTTKFETASEQALAVFRKRLYADDETFIVGSIGRLNLDKGLDILCEAFMEASLPNAKLAILGEGPERKRLNEYVKRCPDIILMGYVDNAKKWMRGFNLYASTARSEPFGMTILDAMQLDLPILASRALGPQDILGNANPRLVDIGDVAGTAKALRAAYEQREGRAKYDLTLYQPDYAHTSLIECYDALLATPRRQRPLLTDPKKKASIGSRLIGALGRH